jgi:hypothetical protein
LLDHFLSFFFGLFSFFLFQLLLGFLVLLFLELVQFLLVLRLLELLFKLADGLLLFAHFGFFLLVEKVTFLRICLIGAIFFLLSQMSKWGFLKNVININTFFATSKDVKQAAKAGIKVDANGTKTGKQDKSEEKEDSADKTDSEEGDLFNKQKKTKVSKQK